MSLAGMFDGAAITAAKESADATSPAFAAIETHRSLEGAFAAWSALMPLAFATPYQNPSFLKAWIEHVAPRERVRPMIVVARDSQGRPAAVLPFGVRRRFGVRVASFLGGSHCNYNMPVIRRDRAASFTPSETARLLGEAARRAGVDVYALTNQPETWEDARNPFAALPSQHSPDPAFSGPLAADAETQFRQMLSAKGRSKQRRKMRRFEELGSPRLYLACAPEDRARLLEAYLAQKREQLVGRGISNVFDKPGVHDFLAAAASVSGGEAAVDLYGFELDGEVIAVTGALAQGRRYSGMFNSITGGEHAKYSPGELLMTFVVEEAIRRGFTSFDLGVGVAPYKRMFCPEVDQLFDSMFGVTPAGRAAAAAISAARAAKARIKASPTAYGLLDRARKLRAKRPAGEPAAADDEE